MDKTSLFYFFIYENTLISSDAYKCLYAIKYPEITKKKITGSLTYFDFHVLPHVLKILSVT